MKRRIALLAPTLILIAGLPCSWAGGLAAEPGLWKVTVSSKQTGQTHSDTNCIKKADIENPGAAFGQPPSNAQESCKRTKFEQTINSVVWKFECSGQATMKSEGQVTFDTPKHYTGTIRLAGTMMGHPIDNTIHMEGHRVGECPAASASPSVSQ
jgi:Protein of unknown function (DUF3617)